MSHICILPAATLSGMMINVYYNFFSQFSRILQSDWPRSSRPGDCVSRQPEVISMTIYKPASILQKPAVI